MLLLHTGLRLTHKLAVGLSCTPVEYFFSMYHVVLYILVIVLVNPPEKWKWRGDWTRTEC